MRNRPEPHRRVYYARRHRDYVDIHEVGTGEIGTWGRKGVALPLERWAWLKTQIGEIDKAVDEATTQKDANFKIHICVTTGIRCIDMRKWYMDTQAVLRPGRTGIALKIPEWVTLRDLIPEMLARSYKLRTAEICVHYNQDGHWDCPDCCPNGIS